jgi:hypothetical protein
MKTTESNKNSWCPIQDSNRIPHKFEFKTLPLRVMIGYAGKLRLYLVASRKERVH